MSVHSSSVICGKWKKTHVHKWKCVLYLQTANATVVSCKFNHGMKMMKNNSWIASESVFFVRLLVSCHVWQRINSILNSRTNCTYVSYSCKYDADWQVWRLKMIFVSFFLKTHKYPVPAFYFMRKKKKKKKKREKTSAYKTWTYSVRPRENG